MSKLAPAKSLATALRQCYATQLLWAAGIGLASGLVCAGVRLFFQWLQWLVTGHAGLLPHAAALLPLWRRALTPFLGAIAASLVLWAANRFGAPQLGAKKKFREYVEAVRWGNGIIPFAPAFWRTLSSSFSIATGAAIGREGSMIQFAATVTSWLGRRLNGWAPAPLSLSRQVACGVAAAVAAAYQAPLAGAFFALEIVLGEFTIEAVPLLLTAAFVGRFATRPILGGGPIFLVPQHVGFGISELWPVLVAAALFGVLGPVYYRLVHSLGSLKKLPFPLLWSGALVGALSLYQTAVWGNGDVALLRIVHGPMPAQTVLTMLAVRFCATAFCVGTGTVGGVFTPTLFVGSAVGFLFGCLIHAPNPLLFAVLGMACLLAAATHAPWMAIFMAVELTGQWSLFPVLVASSLVAWQVAKTLSSNSLYALATPEPAEEPMRAAPAGLTGRDKGAEAPRKELEHAISSIGD